MSASDINRKVNIDFKGDVSDLNKKIDSVGSAADKMGNKVKAAGEKGKIGMDKLGAGAQKAKVDMAAVAVSIQAMTAQIAGMAQQILDFESKLIALEKTALGVRQQQLSLNRQMEDFAEAAERGELSARDYQRGIEDMELAFLNMRLEQKNVSAETNKLNGEFVTFGITAVGTVAQIATAFAAMGITATGALTAVAGGVRLVGTALTTLMRHPVFIIITAGIIAWELGLKSIVEQLTGIDDLGIFSNIEKFFTSVVPDGTERMGELNNEWAEQENQLRKNNPLIEQQSDKLNNLGESAKGAKNEITKLSAAQEQLMRSGGFRAGAGNPLSSVIDREADKIDRATARTLAAASLHQALRDSGLTGSLSSRNISGSLSPDGFNPRIGKSGPLGGLGGATLSQMSQDLAAKGVSPEMSATIIAKSFAKGASQSTVGGSAGSQATAKSFGGSLTRSAGTGIGKRRSGRDRNPRGRRDKLINKIKSEIKERQNQPTQKALFELTGIGFGRGFKGFQRSRFGNNAGLSSDQMRSALLDEFREQTKAKLLEQGAAFNQLVAEERLTGARNLGPVKFLRLRSTPGAFDEIRGVLNFQRKNGETLTGVTF